jgi:hypothetical protein
VTRRLPQLSALLAAAVAIALPACGDSNKDSNNGPTQAQAEAAIKTKYTKLLQAVTQVECPSDIPSEENATFRCTATFNSGDRIPIEGTLGPKGEVTYERLGLLTRRLEQIIVNSVTRPKGYAAGREAGAICPRTRALKPGDVFTCKLTVTGRPTRTLYVVQQRLGRIKISFRKPAGA